DEKSLPKEFALEQNFPNPFNPETVIRYALPVEGHVTLEVFNTLGEKVAELVNAEMPAGEHSVVFNAANLVSGNYLYRITSGTFVQVRKLTLIR
ncbi:MAG: T9SS C-terminal target domain-containing protein, partial [Chlorobiota bacterium]